MEIEQKRLSHTLESINEQNEEEVSNITRDKDAMVDSIRKKCRQLLEEKDEELERLGSTKRQLEAELVAMQKKFEKLRTEVEDKKKVDRNERFQMEHDNQVLKRKLDEQEDRMAKKLKEQEQAYVEVELDRHNLRRQVDHSSIPIIVEHQPRGKCERSEKEVGRDQRKGHCQRHGQHGAPRKTRPDGTPNEVPLLIVIEYFPLLNLCKIQKGNS